MGIEPMLGPHLGHTVYKTVGASSYTNPAEKMGRDGFEPSTYRLCLPLQFSLPLSGLWSGLYLHPFGCSPSSLYTFILRCLARYYHFKGFTEFEEFFFISKKAQFFKK